MIEDTLFYVAILLKTVNANLLLFKLYGYHFF